MGWVFSLALFIMGVKAADSIMYIAAGLFAIAGAIAFKDFYNRKG